MSDLPPQHAAFWEAIRPWLQGGLGSIVVGTGVAVRWLYGVYRNGHRDAAAAETARFDESVKARAQLSGEQTLMFDRLNADNLGLRTRNRELETEKRDLERDRDKWWYLAGVCYRRLAFALHDNTNLLTALRAMHVRAQIDVPPEYLKEPIPLPPLEEMKP